MKQRQTLLTSPLLPPRELAAEFLASSFFTFGRSDLAVPRADPIAKPASAFLQI